MVVKVTGQRLKKVLSQILRWNFCGSILWLRLQLESMWVTLPCIWRTHSSHKSNFMASKLEKSQLRVFACIVGICKILPTRIYLKIYACDQGMPPAIKHKMWPQNQASTHIHTWFCWHRNFKPFLQLEPDGIFLQGVMVSQIIKMDVCESLVLSNPVTNTLFSI